MRLSWRGLPGLLWDSKRRLLPFGLGWCQCSLRLGDRRLHLDALLCVSSVAVAAPTDPIGLIAIALASLTRTSTFTFTSKASILTSTFTFTAGASITTGYTTSCAPAASIFAVLGLVCRRRSCRSRRGRRRGRRRSPSSRCECECECEWRRNRVHTAWRERAMALCWASVGALHALMTERRRGRVNRRSEGNQQGQPTSDAEMSAARLHAARRIQTRLRTLISVRHARNGSQRLPTRELDEADDMDL